MGGGKHHSSCCSDNIARLDLNDRSATQNYCVKGHVGHGDIAFSGYDSLQISLTSVLPLSSTGAQQTVGTDTLPPSTHVAALESNALVNAFVKEGVGYDSLQISLTSVLPLSSTVALSPNSGDFSNKFTSLTQ
jgi:hypothetical protein